MDFNRERVLANVRQAETEDLLDRITAYRAGMEPEAVEMIEAELRRRGVTQEQIDDHAAGQKDAIRDPDGTAVRCSFCERPAVMQRWTWRRMRARGLAAIITGILPLYLPSFCSYCAVHAPQE